MNFMTLLYKNSKICTKCITNFSFINLRFCRFISNLNTKDESAKFNMFFNKKVQNCLNSIIGRDPKVIYRPTFRKPDKPKYSLVTDSELKKMLEEGEKQIASMLHIPPVLQEAEEIDCILSEDYDLADHDKYKYVFTDISYGIPDLDRSIVVREPNGILRLAKNDERKRMLQTFFPMDGRKHKMPSMFTEKYLEKLLDKGEYEYILDRACIQFEPNELDYIRVTRRVYEYINNKQDFMTLYSTRHFGALSFFLAIQKRMDILLSFFINKKLIQDAKLLIHVYYYIHKNDDDMNILKIEEMSPEDTIKEYMNFESNNKSVIELSLQAYQDSLPSVVEHSS